MPTSISRSIILSLLTISLFTSCKKDQKTAVIVIGAPRSGTSCVSGVLNILGIDFGDNLCEPNPFNEKGGFEDKAFSALTHSILKELGVKAYEPRIINWQTESQKEVFKQKIKTEVAQFKDNSFGIKYPAITLILPLYLEALNELGYHTKLVIVLRNPDEIAASWFARWERPKEMAYAAISKFYFNIIKYTHQLKTHVIYFDDLILNTEAEIMALNHFLPGTHEFDQIKEKLADFIDKELKHQNMRKALALIQSLLDENTQREYQVIHQAMTSDELEEDFEL